MSIATLNISALENEGFRELTADEMANVQGGATFADYGLLMALISAAL